jgi:uncharacterized protein YlxW (UPF0749 family)
LSRWRFAVPAVAALAGTLFATSAVTAHGSDLRSRRDSLPELVAAKEREVQQVREAVADVRREVDAATGTNDVPATATGTDVGSVRSEADALLAPTGLTAVRGPAVTVVLTDAPRESRSLPLAPWVAEPTPDDLVVHQQDVQAVVNALWAGGAEAMTIMDLRVTALTAVRCVGNTLMLQGNVFSPPFKITAVGDTERLLDALATDPGVKLFRRYVEAYHLGYEVDVAADVVLPLYSGRIDLLAAAVP